MSEKPLVHKEKVKIGRPPKYSNPEDLQKKIEEYFNNPPRYKEVRDKDGNLLYTVPILTITGLILYCGFCDRHSFYEYEKKPNFSHTIKKARAFIEHEYEGLLQQGLGAGAIFALKNFGWKDRNEERNDLPDEDLEFDGVSKPKNTNRFAKYYN